MVARQHTERVQVWKRIRPRLENILTKRKAHRLEEERRQRRLSRISGLQIELQSLALRKTPNSAQATSNHRLEWMCTFPRTEQEILQVPSLSAIAQDDNIILISDAFKVQESQIMEDISIFQMQTRRVLVSLLRRVEAVVAGVAVDRTGTIFPDLWDQPDTDTLRNEDHANLVSLNKPTALFLINPMSHCAAYPFTFFGGTPIDAALERMSRVYTIAAPLVKALGFEEATMEHMLGLGDVFVCECCPAGIPRLYSWTSLVSCPVDFAWSEQPMMHRSMYLPKLDHYDKEDIYYTEEKRWQENICSFEFRIHCPTVLEPEAWINTHASPRVSMPDLESYRGSLVSEEPGDELYSCLHCSLDISHSLISVTGTWMPRHVAILHLRER